MSPTLTLRAAAAAAALTLAPFAASAVSLIGLTSANELAMIDTGNFAGSTRVAITGLAAGDSLVGIDLRPSNGMIYGLGTSGRLYTLDAVTGMATAGAMTTVAVDAGRGYGIDFNPVADYAGNTSLRLVSSTGENYAINATTGATTVATSIAAGFSGVSYSNSKVLSPPAPASTALYYINSSADTLSVATSGFNNPTINLVGSLGVDVLKANGFEVLSNGMAFAAMTLDNASLMTGIFSIDIASGQATMLGNYTGTLSGLTVSPVPEPGTYALMGLGLLGIVVVSRRRRAD